MDDETQRGFGEVIQPEQAKATDFHHAGQGSGRRCHAIRHLNLVIRDQRPAVIHQTKQQIGFTTAGRPAQQNGIVTIRAQAGNTGSMEPHNDGQLSVVSGQWSRNFLPSRSDNWLLATDH
jgi:hypothetical protein